jgi:hypothetical protein
MNQALTASTPAIANASRPWSGRRPIVETTASRATQVAKVTRMLDGVPTRCPRRHIAMNVCVGSKAPNLPGPVLRPLSLQLRPCC